VRVVARPLANTPLLLWRARRVAALLARLDPAVPRVRIVRREVDLVGDFVGEGYGAPTREAEQAQLGLAQAERALEGARTEVVTEVTRAFFQLTAARAKIATDWPKKVG